VSESPSPRQTSVREVLLDTETTGRDPLAGHRIIEIACIELRNHVRTGRTLHFLIDPERDIEEDATKVHGMTRGMLTGKPVFAEVAETVHEFLADAPIVAHNAPFDIGFLNAEFGRLRMPHIVNARAVDTVLMARARFPGLPNNLDALCRRFDIDLSARTKHNALLDAELLAEVYLQLLGGRQLGLGLAAARRSRVAVIQGDTTRTPRAVPVTDHELAVHAAFVAGIKGSLWPTPAPLPLPGSEALPLR